MNLSWANYIHTDTDTDISFIIFSGINIHNQQLKLSLRDIICTKLFITYTCSLKDLPI